MWLWLIPSLLFSTSDADPLAVAQADPSGLVRVSFDSGDTWIAVERCPAPGQVSLTWRDADLLIACPGSGPRRLDGDELRAHWAVIGDGLALALVGPTAGGATESGADLARRAARRDWLPAVELSCSLHQHQTTDLAFASEVVWRVSLRWSLSPPADSVR